MNVDAPVMPSRIDSRQLRRSLSCFPTGVAIVTTIGRAGGPVGLTISSFNSVSMDPPLVLLSLALNAGSLADFRRNPWFAINVLSAEQSDLARTFSTAVADRFAGVRWHKGLGGAPVLSDSAAVFECSTYNRYDGGDHEIIVGEVRRHASSDRTPLVFGKGRLGAFDLAASA